MVFLALLFGLYSSNSQDRSLNLSHSLIYACMEIISLGSLDSGGVFQDLPHAYWRLADESRRTVVSAHLLLWLISNHTVVNILAAKPFECLKTLDTTTKAP